MPFQRSSVSRLQRRLDLSFVLRFKEGGKAADMKLSRRIRGISGAFILGALSLGAKAPNLTPGETGRVASIVDGDTLFLDSGLKVRLSAMQSPKLPLGRPNYKAWPLGDEAKAKLSELALGKQVRLYYGGLRRDRHDRALAQVYVLDETGNPQTWLQETMIERGYGRVYTWPDTWQNSDKLYAAELRARDAGKGIWGHEFYAVRSPDPDKLAQDIDSFQIVEGLVTKTAKVKDRIYLNFGASYQTDFTIVIEKRAQKRFQNLDYDLLDLEGHWVRVRGWVEMDNGPAIWLDHPERLEVLK